MTNSGQGDIPESVEHATNMPVSTPGVVVTKPDLDLWLQDRVWLVALVITTVGFVLRVLAAAPAYLNPDEAVHFLMANKSSLAAVYQSNLYNANPPMLHVILYFLRGFGNSDFMLRLPSVLASTATLWVAFKWLSGVLGKNAGLVGLTLLAFAPEVTRLSVQVREYSILVFFIVSALFFLERAFREKSPVMMALFGIMLILSSLIHYAAVLFAAAIGLYALSRIIRDRPPAKAVGVWIAGQVVTAALAAFFYVTHIAKLRGSDWEALAKQEWLRASYFHPREDSILFFPIRQTVAVFEYLFSSDIVGIIGLLFFLAGVVFLFIVSVQGRIQGKRRDFGLLLVLPFVVGCGAALFGFYPYGGSRPSFHLIVFGVAGVSFLVGKFAGKKLWPVLLATVVLMPLWNITAHPPDQSIDPRDQRRSLMTAAMDYVRQITPSGGIVLSDHQTQLLLSRYLCGNRAALVKTQHQDFQELSCEEYRLVMPIGVWAFQAKGFGERLSQMAEVYGLEPGDRVCVVSAGWGENLADGLARRSTTTWPGLRKFGRAISVFQVVVGSEPSSVARIRRKLNLLARIVAEQVGQRLPTVLWPSDCLSDSARRLAARLSDRVFSYSEFYQKVTSGEHEVDEYLPALAFWTFDTNERHPEFMAYMNEGENYISAGYRFTLVGVDPDSIAGVYLIEPLVFNQ